MASAYAKKLCPELLIVPGRMSVYREVSQAIQAIFADYTPLIQPLSLDEAYLDVTDSQACRGSATLMAKEIRQRVRDTQGITVSAGVAPNKFIAKIASDWNKPDGLKVVLDWYHQRSAPRHVRPYCCHHETRSSPAVLRCHLRQR